MGHREECRSAYVMRFPMQERNEQMDNCRQDRESLQSICKIYLEEHLPGNRCHRVSDHSCRFLHAVFRRKEVDVCEARWNYKSRARGTECRCPPIMTKTLPHTTLDANVGPLLIISYTPTVLTFPSSVVQTNS